jgi:hypothetical protein
MDGARFGMALSMAVAGKGLVSIIGAAGTMVSSTPLLDA